LLLQGSIQHLEVPVDFAVLLAHGLAERVDSFVVSDQMMKQAEQIAKRKYGAAEWNCRR
jgi:hypothetical protein